MREHFGQAGHFIAADRCRFHLHTHVRGYCVSTVGDYYPRVRPGGEEVRETIGVGRFYETMVFRLGPDGAPESYVEVDSRSYQERDDANAGHEAMVRKFEGCVEHTECRDNYAMGLACRASLPSTGEPT